MYIELIYGCWGHYESGRKGVHWIDLAHDRDKWRSLVNTVIVFHRNWEISLLPEKLLSSQKGSMELVS